MLQLNKSSSLFAYGFRSNFFLAGLAGLLLVPLWALSFVWGARLGSGWPPTLWHGHEMLFGFIASAIAGFLLTAVPSWMSRGAGLMKKTFLPVGGTALKALLGSRAAGRRSLRPASPACAE